MQAILEIITHTAQDIVGLNSPSVGGHAPPSVPSPTADGAAGQLPGAAEPSAGALMHELMSVKAVQDAHIDENAALAEHLGLFSSPLPGTGSPPGFSPTSPRSHGNSRPMSATSRAGAAPGGGSGGGAGPAVVVPKLNLPTQQQAR